MVYLVIFIGICLVIGPVLWLQPSASQKRKAKMRSEAMAKGLQVNLCELPKLEKQYGEKRKEFNGVAYRMSWRRDDKRRQAEVGSWFCIKGKAEAEGVPPLWEWKDDKAPSDDMQKILFDVLPQMPKDVVAVESTPETLSIYWSENGQLGDVDRIVELLESLRKG